MRLQSRSTLDDAVRELNFEHGRGAVSSLAFSALIFFTPPSASIILVFRHYYH